MADEVLNLRLGDSIRIKVTDNLDETHSISTSLHGVNISEGALDVHVKSIHSNMINQTMHFETTTTTLFAVAPTAQDRTFTVVDSTGFAIGDRIQIENGIVETDYPSILNISVNDITINRPLDKSYNITTDGIRKILTNMAVDGSVTPVSFKVVAETSLALTHITRFMFEMTHPTAGDLSKFGSLDPLERGVLVRAFYDRTGEYKTVSSWRTNADIKRDMFNVPFDERAGGQGAFGTTGRWTLTSAGIVALLEPNGIDFIEILIQDNLTGLDSFTMNAQGHTED